MRKLIVLGLLGRSRAGGAIRDPYRGETAGRERVDPVRSHERRRRQ
jgi:hypothetical protein